MPGQLFHEKMVKFPIVHLNVSELIKILNEMTKYVSPWKSNV